MRFADNTGAYRLAAESSCCASGLTTAGYSSRVCGAEAGGVGTNGVNLRRYVASAYCGNESHWIGFRPRIETGIIPACKPPD